MSAQIQTYLGGARVSLFLAEKMLKDVRPEIFARKPAFGSTTIDANHAAFHYGHLAIYPSRWLEFCGFDPAPAAAPAGFADLFAAGKECRDDPDGSIYPAMDTITEAFFTTHRAALDRLADLSDAALAAPNPREGRMKEMFPTVGGMLMFFTNNHIMMHMGQVSTWRRCFGLGPVM